MQYILTEKEYDNLVNVGKDAKKELETVIQELCTAVADHMPIKYWGNDEEKVWGCIKTIGNDWYCDDCPVQKACPCKYKNWSK